MADDEREDGDAMARFRSMLARARRKLRKVESKPTAECLDSLIDAVDELAKSVAKHEERS